MAEISDAELREMQRRAEAATAGPWQSFIEGRDHWGGDDFIRTGGLDDDAPDMYLSLSFPTADSPVAAPAPDLDFIAAARQDLPRLIAEVRRLRSRES